MCKMTTKLLYLVLTVIFTLEGIRGNVEPGSPTPIKHVREVLPNSLLFLLQRRPTSGLGYKKITPVSPIPLSPSAPIEPCAPLPPSIPAIPNAPVSLSIPYSPEAPDIPNSGIVPKSFYPTVKYRQNEQQTTQISSSGQLSYDNPSNGNRKILNIVHINPRQPVPISHQTLPETLATNPAVPDNKVTGESKDLSTNSFQISPKDIPFEPVKNIEASPIPVQTKNTEVVPSQATNKDSEIKDNKDLDESKNSSQINPKDIPFEPVKNIESSPIPVKPQNTEVAPSQATDVDNDSKENKDLDESTNRVQFNPKDIPFEPVKNIEASPIPVQTKNTEVVPSQATNKDSETKENKDLDESKNSSQINPKDIPLEPVTNIEASPIPVQQKNTDVLPSQATNVNSASPIAETSKEGQNPDLSSFAGNNEANTTPVKSQIKPEPSEEKAAVTDSVNTPDVSSASEHNIAEASITEEPQNPLKDLVLNGNPSNKNAEKEESKNAEGSENKADTQNGNSSSKNEEHEGKVSEKHEDNLNKETTESESTSYESPTDGTHSASTYDESKYTSFPEGSHSESTKHQSEATSSDNSHSQSTDSQSESLSTKSNTESSNGSISETVSSENTENKS